MIPAEYMDIGYAVVLSLVAGAPLIGALGCCLPSARKAGWSLLPWATLPALFTGLAIPGDVVIRVPWFFMGGLMGIDHTGRIFLCLSAFIWLLAAFKTEEKFRESRQGELRFSGYFLVAMAGNFGLILARDMLGFYLFFAIMSFACYGLIVHNRTPEARRAGRIYLVLVMVSELAMFTALVLISTKAQSQSLADISDISLSMPGLFLLFVAFGVKVGALPLHAWMAPAYQQSPIPGAIALAGAMVNAGILGWLRFIPLGYMVSGSGALLFITAGALATFYGVVYGLGQRKIGRVLASSSMSQMGLMTLIVGLGLCSQQAGNYAVYLLPLYAVHHSLCKGGLFLGYDAVENRARLVSPLLMIAILLPSLSLAGLPFTSGAIVKTGFKELALISGDAWYSMGKVFLPLSSLGTTVLMLHCSRLLWRRRAERKKPQQGEVAVWPLAAALTGAAFWLWFWPAAAEPAAHSLDFSLVMQALWPVAAGSVLALLWFVLLRRLEARTGQDLMEGEGAKGVNRLWSVLPGKIGTGFGIPYRDQVMAGMTRWFSLAPASPLGQGLRKPEKVLGRWSVVGFCYLSVCLVLLLLFFKG